MTQYFINVINLSSVLVSIGQPRYHKTSLIDDQQLGLPLCLTTIYHFTPSSTLLVLLSKYHCLFGGIVVSRFAPNGVGDGFDSYTS